MKKYICLLTAVLLSVFVVSQLYAQQNTESDIQAIRELYQQTLEFVKHDKEDPTLEYQLTLSLRRHHTVEGHVNYDYNFYFDCLNTSENSLSGLKFIRIKITDRGGISDEEYLFNDKEELVFYFSKFSDYENQNDVEIRFYYKNGKRIRNLVKTTGHKNKKVTDYTVIPEDYKYIAERLPAQVRKIKSLYKLAMEH